MRTIDKLREITKCLTSNGFEFAEKEAEILVRHGLHINTVEIYRDNPELTEEQVWTLEDILRRRLRSEPLQYILGYEEFLGLRLLVAPGVLIPRPETEFMAEQAMKAVNGQQLTVNSKNQNFQLPSSRFSVLDLCTGSGCLALALAKAFPYFKVYGSDISEIAIEYAKENAGLNCINNVTFLTGNLFEPVERLFTPLERKPCSGFLTGFTFDLIISNPPYVKTDDIKNLQPEIRNREPTFAIDGGADGLDFYRELIPAARRFLNDQGLIILEVGACQSREVAEIFEASGYIQTGIIKDYAGIERIVQAKWRR